MDDLRETPGTTTRLIVQHVRRRAGDDAVAALHERAGLPHDTAAVVDESRWSSDGPASTSCRAGSWASR